MVTIFSSSFLGDTAASTGAMAISKHLFLSVPNRWDHGLVPVVFSIPLGGGALDVGNPQVGASFLFSLWREDWAAASF